MRLLQLKTKRNIHENKNIKINLNSYAVIVHKYAGPTRTRACRLRYDINHIKTRRNPVANVSLFCYNSNTNKKGKLMGNLADEIATYEVGCLYYEICGTSETFSQEEYDIYGDDYVCPECQDSVSQFYLDSFPMSLEYDEAY